MTDYSGSPPSKLQVLKAAGVVDPNAETLVSSEELDAIEKLSWTEVDNLISARAKTGKQVGIFWI